MAEQKFIELTDTTFVDLDTVSVWQTLTMRVYEYICAGVHSTEKLSTVIHTEVREYVVLDMYEFSCI